MIISTHFRGTVVYISQQYYCQARLYSGEKIDRAYYFHFLIRFCFAAASSMLHHITYHLICVCVCSSAPPQAWSWALERCCTDLHRTILASARFGRGHCARGLFFSKSLKVRGEIGLVWDVVAPETIPSSSMKKENQYRMIFELFTNHLTQQFPLEGAYKGNVSPW